MHASDTILNLLADGHAVDPQPWARSDLLLAGPPDDPARVRGEVDPVKALKKINDSKSILLIHPSLGTNEVLHELLAEDPLELDPMHTVSLTTDRNQLLLQRAHDEHAYALIGRIPFLNGKIANEGLEIMVAGDDRMCRPHRAMHQGSGPATAWRPSSASPQHRLGSRILLAANWMSDRCSSL